MNLSILLSTITSIVFTAIKGLLGLRIILRLLSANPGSPFVQWIYQVSGALLRPFANIFPTPTIEQGVVIDFPALFALFIYGFVGYLITLAIHWLSVLDWRIKKRQTAV